MAHQYPSLVAETGVLTSGVVVVSGAVAGYRTFAAALADADTVDVVLKDSNDVQASYPASTWNETAGTLTLGLEDEASGVVVDGAVTIWAASDSVLRPTDVNTLAKLNALIADATLGVWRTGTGAPADGLGNDGDYYLDSGADAWYGPKAAGTWTGTGPNSLQGPAGADGSDGAPGADGSDGLGWTGGSYDASTGIVTFTSDDGLGFTTGDLRGADGVGGGGSGVTYLSDSQPAGSEKEMWFNDLTQTLQIHDGSEWLGINHDGGYF